jgi:hypothetical protein
MRAIVFAIFISFLTGCASSDPRVAESVARGVKHLQESQQPEGYWGTGLETRGTEIYSMVPGSHDAFRVGTTALCIMALKQAGETTAHDKALEWLLKYGEARRDDGALIYNTWAHIYSTHALALEMRTNKDPRIAERLKYHVDELSRYATYAGGWNYYDFDSHTQLVSMGATSFGTAAGLIALYEARQSRIDVPQRMIDLAVHRVEESRLPNGLYLYGVDYKYKLRLPANKQRGAIGRTQPSNYSLLIWDSKTVSDADARQGLKLFWDDHAFLEMGRKRPYPHESWYQTSGYYYYFDHYYASLLISHLKSAPDARKMIDTIVSHQEPDGSWWDYAMWDYHKPYGTAFAVMTLLESEKIR